MSKKQVATDREWLIAVTASAAILPAGFFFLWHYYFDSWLLSLIYTCIVAGGAKAEWDHRFTAPDTPASAASRAAGGPSASGPS